MAHNLAARGEGSLVAKEEARADRAIKLSDQVIVMNGFDEVDLDNIRESSILQVDTNHQFLGEEELENLLNELSLHVDQFVKNVGRCAVRIMNYLGGASARGLVFMPRSMGNYLPIHPIYNPYFREDAPQQAPPTRRRHTYGRLRSFMLVNHHIA